MTQFPSNSPSPRGRHQDEALTVRILDAALAAVAEHGPEGARLAEIARAAGTSQQALHRRWPDKAGLLLAALEHGLAGLSDLRAGRAGFQRTTAGELAAFLSQACQRLCGTVLGRALARLPRNAQGCPMAQLVAGLEDEWRLALRQMLIATPFEAALTARIELVTGFLRLQTGAPQPPQQRLIEDTAALVLGLIAPAQPQSPGSAEAAMPGL